MSKKTLSEEIEARLDKQNGLSGYDSVTNAESIVNKVKNEINSKMMNGEELDDDTLKAIKIVSEAFDFDPESFTRNYLEGMESEGHDIASMQEKINSYTGSNNNVGASDTTDTSPKREEKSNKDKSKKQPSLSRPTPAKKEHKAPIGIIIKNLKKAVKLGKKSEGIKIEKLRGQVDTLLRSIDYSILQAEEIHELLQLEEPIYKIFGLKISDYRDGFFDSQRGTGYEQGLKAIRTSNAHLQPKDIIEQISGAEIGSPEYMHTKEMISELQDINSTERINKNLKYLAMFGIAGMILSFVIGIMGFHYDIIYHFPFMETVLPSWVIWIFAIFGTGLIMALLHIPMDSLVNRKYMSVSRKLLAILLLFGLPLKVYIDYKAIVNYSNQVAESKRQDSLKDKTKVIGSSFANIQKAKDNQEKTIERIGKQIEVYNKQLEEIAKLREPHQKFIDKFSKMKWTKWRSDNIAKHQKELKKLDMREASIQNHINMLQHQQEQYMGVLTKNTEKLNSLLSQSEEQAKEEADNRFKMMSAMLFLIELASMLKIYSEFIRNKNTPITLDVLNRINTFLDAGETIDAMGYKLSETINRANMAKGQHIQEVINHQIYGQISTEQGIIRNTQNLLQLSQENTKQSMELIEDMIRGQHAMIQNQKMSRQLEYYRGGNKND